MTQRRACEILKPSRRSMWGRDAPWRAVNVWGSKPCKGPMQRSAMWRIHRRSLRRGHKGVYVKAAKARPGPADRHACTIGPGHDCGLLPKPVWPVVMIEAGRVMILERDKTLQAD